MRNTAFIAASLAMGAIGRAQNLTDDQIAAKFIPQGFTVFAAENTYLADDRTWQALPVDLDRTGREDYLAVAYGNGHIAYLSVIRKGASPSLVAESAAATACDGSPGVSTIDLEGDGKPELVLSCHIGNHGVTFRSIFKWSTGALIALNPPHARRVNAWAPLCEANFADIDGDGIMEVLEADGGFTVDDQDFVTQRWNVYRLVNGRLTQDGARVLPYFGMFVRGKGQPRTNAEQFVATPGKYTLTIANGERGQNMVNSCVITLNGATIASPSLFSKNVKVITMDVVLAAKNTLSVQLRSSPGSLIHVIFATKP